MRNVVARDGEWVRAPTINLVSLQILYNEEEAAMRLVWDDPTEDRNVLGDALALLFKPEVAQGDVVTLQAWPYQGAVALDICFWSAESGQVQEGVGQDYASVRDQKVAVQSRQSIARYEEGQWQMMVRRPLSGPGLAVIDPSKLLSVGIAVWDGGNDNAQSVTPWLDVALKPIGPSEPHGH